MQRMKQIGTGIALCAALMVSTTASATHFKGAGSFTFNAAQGTGTFFDIAIPAGAFTDTITFPDATIRTLRNVYLDFNTSGFVGALTAKFNGFSLTASPSPLFVGGTRLSLSLLSLPVGTQTLTISGNSLGGGFASIYAGALALSPVPEPASWILMIGGLGLAGASLRRRRVTVSYG